MTGVSIGRGLVPFAMILLDRDVLMSVLMSDAGFGLHGFLRRFGVAFSILPLFFPLSGLFSVGRRCGVSSARLGCRFRSVCVSIRCSWLPDRWMPFVENNPFVFLPCVGMILKNIFLLMATPLISPVVTIYHPDTGFPLALGKVYAYASGTNTPKATYADEGMQTQHDHPVVLNGAGQANIFLDGEYKFVVKDSDDAQIFVWDPVSDFDPDVDEWLGSISATYVSPSSFRVSGDRTATFCRGRPVKLTDGSTPPIIAHVDSSSYSSPDTTISIYSAATITACLDAVQPSIITTPPLSTLASSIAMAGGRSSGIRKSAIFCCDDTIGGSSDYLDGIDGLSGGPVVNGLATPLQDGDIAFVGSERDGTITTYVLDEDSGAAASDPDIVAPATNPGLKRWVRKDSYINRTDLLNVVYPVGCIYSETTGINPNATFGFGSWELWGIGRVPICVDFDDPDFQTAGEIGGAKDVTLTAAQSGVPEHSHTTGENSVDHTHTGTTSINGEHTHSYTKFDPGGSGDSIEGDESADKNAGATTDPAGQHEHTVTTGGVSANHTHNVNENTAADASDAHNNMPPFIAEYRWKRTA